MPLGAAWVANEIDNPHWEPSSRSRSKLARSSGVVITRNSEMPPSISVDSG